MKTSLRLMATGLSIALLGGCASQPKTPFDYTQLKAHPPRSILVLPPLNKTPEMRASYSVLAQVTQPLAESGYYVMPVTLVDETFKENGITEASDAHSLPSAKLREIFGADAALYITVTQYGTVYRVLDSATTVAAEAQLIDLKTEKVLWTGKASASTAEQQNQTQGGLAVLLIAALVKQVIGSVSDHSHPMAGLTSQRLLKAGRVDGLLHGPRSPLFAKEP